MKTAALVIALALVGTTASAQTYYYGTPATYYYAPSVAYSPTVAYYGSTYATPMTTYYGSSYATPMTTYYGSTYATPMTTYYAARDDVQLCHAGDELLLVVLRGNRRRAGDHVLCTVHVVLFAVRPRPAGSQRVPLVVLLRTIESAQFDNGCGLLWRGQPRRQLHDADVAEVNLGAFGLQAEVTLAHRRLAHAVDELAVDRQFHHAVHADHVVLVPLSLALAAVLERLAALPRGLSGTTCNPLAPNNSPWT